MRSWLSLDAMIGDAFDDFSNRIRYCDPTSDNNRARWPAHELCGAVTSTIVNVLHGNRSGVMPQNVKDANRAEHMRMLDRQILGLFVSRAATSDVNGPDFEISMERHVEALHRYSEENPSTISERLEKGGTDIGFAKFGDKGVLFWKCACRARMQY
jgi:hypothetical protein